MTNRFCRPRAARRCLGLALTLLVWLAGCTSWPREGMPSRGEPPAHPPPEGPVDVVGQGVIDGEAWELTAYRSNQGICVDLHMGSGSGGSCGFGPMRGDLSITSRGWNADLSNYAQLEGRVSEEVARLTARSGEGPVQELSVYESNRFGLTFFVAFAPIDADYELIAYDDGGEVLERKRLTRAELGPRG